VIYIVLIIRTIIAREAKLSNTLLIELLSKLLGRDDYSILRYKFKVRRIILASNFRLKI
jgi:hypothetical protein